MVFKIDSEAYYSKKEVAELLNIHANTLNKYKKLGLHFTKVGREVFIKGENLIKFLEQKDPCNSLED